MLLTYLLFAKSKTRRVLNVKQEGCSCAPKHQNVLPILHNQNRGNDFWSTQQLDNNRQVKPCQYYIKPHTCSYLSVVRILLVLLSKNQHDWRSMFISVGVAAKAILETNVAFVVVYIGYDHSWCSLIFHSQLGRAKFMLP